MSQSEALHSISPHQHLDQVKRIKFNEPSRMFKQRMDRNERNQPFSEAFINRIKEKVSGELFMVYPELDSIYEKMSKWLGLDAQQILLHSGSGLSIKSVFEVYCASQDNILLHYPSYAMYEVFCKMFNVNIVPQTYDAQLQFDWEAYVDRIQSDIRMVVVENPNGFLGFAPTREQLERIIQKAHQEGVIALIDEAYFHFCPTTVSDLIEKYDNLIISRTFSKALGLAGLRVGYLLSSKINIEALNKVRPAYEINSFAALVVSELLDHPEEIEAYVKDIWQNIQTLLNEFSDLRIATTDSKANFVTAKIGENCILELRGCLDKSDILIRGPFREEFLKDWVRISVAPEATQKILISELRRILGK